ncbi:MAG: flavin reductase [Flavobacteriales bacterium]|nr:MAG: flavin reductase [Flavobacteriales bacterium]
MLTINPKEIEVPKLHHYLLGAVGPRPIAFASTIDANGIANLSPFSFFNVFSANPPIMIFSPARSGRTGATKNTLDNVKEIKEVVINVVNHDIVQQMSLSSSPYDSSIDEFVKSGLTPIPSEEIRPFRVKESPVQFECKVNEIVELGQNGGAGNLVICEVVKIHINEAVLDDKGMIDQHKIDLVSRMGGNWYCRADKNSMFEIQKPIMTIGIGVDQIPENIRNSTILSGNDLGLLGSIEEIPDGSSNDSSTHQEAKKLLAEGKVKEAWEVLLR